MSLTPEQLALRMGGVAGSEIANVAGLLPFGNGPIDTYNVKVGLAPEFVGNEQTDIGTELEPIIAERAAKKRGLRISRNYGVTWQHTTPHFLATPDYYVRHEDTWRILEIKNVGYRMAYSWGDESEGAMGIPPYYRAQLVWQMYVTGFTGTGYLAALIGGREIRTYEVPYDECQALALADCADWFWKRVQEKNPPRDGEMAFLHAGAALCFPKRKKT